MTVMPLIIYIWEICTVLGFVMMVFGWTDESRAEYWCIAGVVLIIAGLVLWSLVPEVRVVIL